MKTHDYEIIIDKAVLDLSESFQTHVFGCSFTYVGDWNGPAFERDMGLVRHLRPRRVTAAKDFVRCP